MKLISSLLWTSLSSSSTSSSSSWQGGQHVIICLGQALQGNQTMPKSLLHRLDHTLHLLHNFNTNNTDTTSFCDVILTGGDVKKCGVSEASAMWSYFQEHCQPLSQRDQTDNNSWTRSSFLQKW